MPVIVAEELEEEISVQIGVKMSFFPREASLGLLKHRAECCDAGFHTP